MPEKGIRFQRYVKYKAKIEPNFGGGEKRIIFGGKVEDMEAGFLAAKGRAPPRVLGGSGPVWMGMGLLCGHVDRIGDGGGCGEGGDGGHAGKQARRANGQSGQAGKRSCEWGALFVAGTDSSLRSG